MRTIFLFVAALWILPWELTAQNTAFEQSLADGDKAIKEQRFKKAAKAYLLADRFDRSQTKVISERLDTLIGTLQSLITKAQEKIEAEKERFQRQLQGKEEEESKRVAENERLAFKLQLMDFELKLERASMQRILEEHKKATENTEKDQQNLTHTVFFDENKFQLAYNRDRDYYYYRDRNGNRISDLKQWDEAKPFDARGFAQVKQGKESYLIDEKGTPYKLAFNVNELSKNTEAVILSSQGLKKLPIRLLTRPENLQILMLDDNELTEIPDQELRKLSNLKYLDLSNNDITDLPDQVANLIKLEFLNLSDNNLQELPLQIGSLSSLKQLIVHSNKMQKMPRNIDQLTSLEYLDVSNNKLKKVPNGISQLLNLKVLDLSENTLLKKIPDDIGNLKHLTTLNLRKIRLGELPSSFCNLQSLTTVNLEGNQLKRLPVEIHKLTNLTTIDVSDNYLTTVPDGIGALRGQLQSLDLRINGVISLKEVKRIQALLPGTSVAYFEDFENTTEAELGATYMKEGNMDKAIEAYKRDIEWNGTLVSYKKLGNCYFQIGKNEEAVRYLRQYHLLERMDLDAIRTLAESNFNLKKYVAAFYYADKATKLNGVSSQDWYRLMRFSLFVKHYDAGIKAATNARKLKSQSLNVEAVLALNYVLNNQWSEAKAIIEKWKGQKLPAQSKVYFDEIMNKELRALEVQKITHPKFEDIKRILNF